MKFRQILIECNHCYRITGFVLNNPHDERKIVETADNEVRHERKITENNGKNTQQVGGKNSN